MFPIHTAITTQQTQFGKTEFYGLFLKERLTPQQVSALIMFHGEFLSGMPLLINHPRIAQRNRVINAAYRSLERRLVDGKESFCWIGVIHKLSNGRLLMLRKTLLLKRFVTVTRLTREQSPNPRQNLNQHLKDFTLRFTLLNYGIGDGWFIPD